MGSIIKNIFEYEDTYVPHILNLQVCWEDHHVDEWFIHWAAGTLLAKDPRIQEYIRMGSLVTNLPEYEGTYGPHILNLQVWLEDHHVDSSILAFGSKIVAGTLLS